MPNAKDSAVFKVGADITEPQKKIAEVLNLVKKLSDGVNASSAISVKAFRAEADAAQELLRAAGANDRQMGQLARTIRGVEGAAESFKDRTGTALRSVSGGLLEMAHSGDISGRALKEVVAQGAEMALSFGAGGPIVGALGIAGIAIFEVFDHARKQIEETRKKFEEETDAMVRKADQIGLITKLRDLELGDPAKGMSTAAPGAFVGGLRDLQAQAAAMRANPDALKDAMTAGAQGAGLGIFAGLAGSIGARQSLADLEKQIAEMVRQRDELTKRIMNPPELPATINGLPTVTVTGTRGGAAPAAAPAQPDLSGRVGPFAPINGQLIAPGRISSAVSDSILNQPTGGLWEHVASNIHEANAGLLEFGANMEDLTTGTVTGFANASVNAFTQWASGSKKIGDALREGIGGAIVEIAGKKAKLYFAEALADTAEGFLGHPGAWAAAGEHAAAGAAMLAIAGGGAMLGASGSRGGGGTRGASNNIGMGDSFASTPAKPGVVKIVGGILDTSDTRQMDALADAIKSLTGRDVILSPN